MNINTKINEAEAVLIAVLVCRGAITKFKIVDAVNQFNVVYHFTADERMLIIDRLNERFI